MILGIYGSGGLGREVLELAKQINNTSPKWREIIFVDDMSKNSVLNAHKVLSFNEVSRIYKADDIEFIIAIGEPLSRKMLWDKVVEKGYKFATLIHPNVFISESTKILSGVVINSGVFISCTTEIGENVYIQPTAGVGHDCKIGSHSVISSFASLGGCCTIGECSFIAMSVPIKEKAKIGSNSIIGLGSVVLRDIPDNVVALGNPARAMKVNENKKVFD